MEITRWSVDYTGLLNEAGPPDYERVTSFLLEELPYAWYDKYKHNCAHDIRVNRFHLNTFEYIFDDCSLTGGETEARLVAVIGRSNPSDKLRRKDDGRLRGWVGPTNKTFGHEWDKGHFIGHSIGGAIDRAEVNVFPQKRILNRGISEEGKLFRAMEDYCAAHAGSLCFNRPLYHDNTARPAFFEFGVLRQDLTLWVNVFDNR